MYTSDDIQEMLTECSNDPQLREDIILFMTVNGSSSEDRFAVKDVMDDGCYERFDRYDSDVCEQFITAYENAKNKEDLER